MLLGRYTYESTRRHNREQHCQRCKTIVFKIVQVCLCLNVRLTLHSSQRNRLWRFKLIWDDPKWGLTAVCEQGYYSLDPRTAGSFVSWMTMNCSMRILSCGVRGLQVWLTADFSGIHSKVTLPKMSLFETFSFSWHGYCSAPNTGGQWSLSKNSHRAPTLFPAWRSYLISKSCSRWIRYTDRLGQEFSSHGQRATCSPAMPFVHPHSIILHNGQQNCTNDVTELQQTNYLVKLNCPATPRRRHGGKVYSSYSLLTSALDWGEWSASGPAATYPRERTPGTHLIEGWVDLRAGLDTEARWKILCLCRGSSPGHPVCSQTLYWATPAPK
jgi:hypothetical protein